MDVSSGLRLTLWRSFSSNHSADFTIVGRFETAAKAEQAADELTLILRCISEWHHQNSGVLMDMRREPLPIEREIGEKYGVEWNAHHNWITPQSSLERAVVAFDNYVLMQTTALTLARPQPFDEIMAKLGASVRFNAPPYFTPLVVTIRCQIIDDQTANILQDLLQRRLRDKYAVMPWLAYETGSRHPDAEKLHSEAELALASRRERDQMLEAVNHAASADDKERHLQRFYEFEAQNRQNWTADSPLFIHWRLCVDQVGDIALVGQELKIEEVRFRSIGSGLPAILAWLKEHGCTQIEYDIIQLDNRPK